MAQGGDITANNGQGGESIYGHRFDDENFTLKHTKPYLLSMANHGKPHSNSSQFFITFRATPWLDDRHTVFGEVLEGFDIVDSLEENGKENGRPKEAITVVNCGILE